MVAHLRSRGRSRVACIAGPLDTPGGRYRLDGYRAEVADLDLGEDLIAYGDYSTASGKRAVGGHGVPGDVAVVGSMTRRPPPRPPRR